mgnify:CR=1 FL=1
MFGLLFALSLALLRYALPEGITTDVSWVASGASQISLALGLMPLAGIAYLWFIGVVRDKLGEYEDRFFSTVFFGSSLLFLGDIEYGLHRFRKPAKFTIGPVCYAGGQLLIALSCAYFLLP